MMINVRPDAYDGRTQLSRHLREYLARIARYRFSRPIVEVFVGCRQQPHVFILLTADAVGSGGETRH
jgi:hypothetical protein